MPGGLIQLVITGVQDSPIIGNPEITFFKTVYKQHTMFSVCQNSRYIGSLNFNKESSKVIERNGDLLYSLYFKLEIPYFEITKQTTNMTSLLTPYNINELSVTYKNMDSLVIYINGDGWYLIPKVLFSLSSFEQYITLIDSSLIEQYVLPDYIKINNYGKNINYYQILDDPISSLINLLRLNSSYWEQYWLNFITTNTELSFNNPLITLKSKYSSIYTLVKNRIFNLYWYNNYTNLNINNFNLEFKLSDLTTDDSGAYIMKTETERYFEYVNSDVITSDVFDIDIVYKYCKDNFLNFSDYRDNILNNNTLCLLLILSILYSDNSIIYTFWKKYNTTEDNNVNINTIVADTHNLNEWHENLNIFMARIFKTNNITNIIYKEFNTHIFNTEQIINNIFSSMNLSDPKTLYIKLKTITDRFNSIPNYQINFNKGFLATYYVVTTTQDINSLYNQDNYEYSLTQETNNYKSLNKLSTSLSTNENENLSPVDITNIFNVIANDVIDLEFELVDTTTALKSFIVLWRNVVVNRLYSNYLDVYNKSSNMNDTDRKMAFYQNIVPANMFSTSDFNNSFYEMFFKNSFLGSVSIDNNNFLKFKENIFKVDIKNLDTDFTNIVTDKNYNKLSITNTYTYIYYETIEKTDNYKRVNFKQVIYDNVNQLLYIKYDNIYNTNTTMVLSINGIITKPSSISQINSLNEYNFKSFYLVFSGILSCPVYATIIITVTYINYVPTLYFYNSPLTYSSIPSTKYMILTKLPTINSTMAQKLPTTNNIGLNNIIDNNILLTDLTFYNTNKIILLTINYFNNLILKPDSFASDQTYAVQISDLISTLASGNYLYSISFYTEYYESDVSPSISIFVPPNSNNIPKQFQIEFSRLPISSNKNVIGRKIYRTRVNDTKFYLLTTIIDNTFRTYIDTINDSELGIDYDINGNIKYNILPDIQTNVTKLPIKLVENISTGLYQINTLSNNIYYLPTDYSNIYEIYIEMFDTNSTTVDAGTINNVGKYTNGALTNQTVYKTFNYLINKTNLMDVHKLVYSNKPYIFPSIPFKLELNNGLPSVITPGKYYYSISLFNTTTQIESLVNNDPGDNSTTATLTTGGVLIRYLPPIYDSTYNSYKIYRTKNLNNPVNNKQLYLLAIIPGYEDMYADIINDNRFNPYYNYNPGFIITDNINPKAINRPGAKPKVEGYIGQEGYYIYVVTYVDNETNESQPSDQTLTSSTSNTIYLPISPDQKVTMRKIYRSHRILTDVSISIPPILLSPYSTTVYLPIENTLLYLLTTIEDNTTLYVFDNIDDIALGSSHPPLPIDLSNYYEFNMDSNHSTPNIYPFISHSSDCNFINNKNISDFNDFLFNKPFLMMINNTNTETFQNTNSTRLDIDLKLMNTFTNPVLYFYNINFKINSTSVITLNDKIVNYLIPISTQQFFYQPNIVLYDIINNKLEQVIPARITELCFNPAFDEINIFSNFLVNNNYYGSVMIDQMISQIDFALNHNSDYSIITNIIDKVINNFINLSTNFLNSSNSTLYGNMTKQVILWIDELNKFYNVFTDKSITLPIINYNNTDYFNYTHNVFRYVIDPVTNYLPAKQLVKFKNNTSGSNFLSTIKILAPVFTRYNSNNKISSNLNDYLTKVASFYMEHIQYINNNADYLKLTNPNIYKEQYLSDSEITQNIYNTFYTYYGNEISYQLLYPIIDQNIYQIIRGNTVISNFTVLDESNLPNNFIYKNNNIPDGIIYTNDPFENKLEELQYDTTQKSINRLSYLDNKFNYTGILNINNTNEIIFDNEYSITTNTKYYKLEDGKIYIAKADNIINQYYIDSDLSDLIVIKPVEIIFNNSTPTELSLTYLIDPTYLYKVELIFNSIPAPPIVNIHTNFIINNQIYKGDLIIEVDKYYLILLLNVEIIFKDLQILFQKVLDDYTSWISTPIINKYNILIFKKINYINNQQLNNNNNIYQYLNNYFSCQEIISLNNTISLDGSYFYINNIVSDLSPTDININIYSDITYILRPTMIIKSNYIYQYYAFNDYTKKLNTIEPTNYILLVEQVNNYHYMLQYKDFVAKKIPYGNYHTWIYPQNYLNLIPYNVNISINSTGQVINVLGIPNYCYYLINDGSLSCIYYYETGNMMNALGPDTYFTLRNIESITRIFLVDSSLFISNSKHLLSIFVNTENIITESYINNTLNILDGTLQSRISLNLNSTDIYFKSRYLNDIFNVYSNNTVDKTNYTEFILKLILIDKTRNIRIYYPLIVRNYIQNTTIPCVNFNNNNRNYNTSFIPILFTQNINNTIGTINYNNTLTSNNNSIIISKSGNIYTLIFSDDFLTNVTNNQLNLWALNGTVSGSTALIKIYFWTFFTINTILIESYLDIGGSFSYPQPFNPSNPLTNIGLKHIVTLSTPANVISTSNNITYTFINPVNTYSLKYKFYTDTRDTNIYNNNKYVVKYINFNSVHNIKPIVELLINNSANTNYIFTNSPINNNVIYYIITYQSIITSNQIIIPILKSNFTTTYNNILNNPDISFLSIYFSINYPLFVNNVINLININNDIYEIVNYQKVYLEMNEIISLDGNYFIVNGLNVFSDNYELKLLSGNNNLRYMYTGYYTLGNYLAKTNNIVPPLDYQNNMTFRSNYQYELFPGEIYFNNSFNINIFTDPNDEPNDSKKDCFCYNDKPLNFSLLYINILKSGLTTCSFLLFDNFIKLKVLDNIICQSNVYEIRAIVDNQIYFSDLSNTNINIINPSIFINYNYYNTNSANSLFKLNYFILSYQPFETLSLNLDDEGYILSQKIDDYQTIVLSILSTETIQNFCQVVNNSVQVDSIYNNTLVKLIKTNYYSNFENIMNVPNDLTLYSDKYNFNFNNQHAISFNTFYNETLNAYQIINSSLTNYPSSWLNIYRFFYLQPVKVSGTFDYIKNILSIKEVNETTYKYYIVLFNNLVIPNTTNEIQMVISPSNITEYNYYLYQQFSYNFSIQTYNYNMLIVSTNQLIEVSRYIIINDKLISIQTYSGSSKIIFTYGITIAENERANNITDGYSSIYFFRSLQLNTNGTINNFDTLLDSYHLITYLENNQNFVYLVKIVYPNKLKFYTLPTALTENNYFNYSCLLDNFPTIRINNLGEYTYSNLVVTQMRNINDINQDLIKIVKQYQVKLTGIPTITDNQYYQQITFINSNVDITIYSEIYLDQNSIVTYPLVYENEKYYIVSDNYLSNSFNTIYTINLNYLKSAQNNKTVNLNLEISDTTILDNYIISQTKNTEILVQNIQLSNINNKNVYNYKLLNNEIGLNSNETLKINSFSYNITQINNSVFTINTSEPIDNDNLQVSNTFTDINLLIVNQIDTNNILDLSNLFPDVKQLKISLLDNSITDRTTIYYYLKSWNSWSLLNSINKVSNLDTLVNLGYIDVNGNLTLTAISGIDYSYLTNDEVTRLSKFIISINSSDLKKNNYNITKQIVTSINNNLIYWLTTPHFFMNAQQNINNYLTACGYLVSFNGTNIIFNNDQNPDLILINEVYEIAGYISNEFTYDDTIKIVYRSITSYEQINIQISNWINKIIDLSSISFGTNIHQLLRYLVTLGTELVNLINTFSNTLTDTPYYIFNNPLKFIINKIWEKNFNTDQTIKNLNTSFNTNLQYNITFENPNNRFASLIEYLPDMSILNFGLNSINYYDIYTYTGTEMNLSKISLNEPSSSIPISDIINLVINPIFPYSITFNSNIIKSNCTYSIDFLNGINITKDIIIINPIIYPGQINFYSEYEIKSSDFLVVKQNISFSITKTTLLGYLYTITFQDVIYQYIDNLYYNNVQLTILLNTETSLNILIPFDSDELQTTDLLEIHNIIGIKNITLSNSNQYIEFYSSKFNFILNNTLLKTNSKLYPLNYDNSINSYYVTGNTIDSDDVTIITLITSETITNLNQVSYSYQLGTSLDSSIYNPSYFEFNIVNATDQTIITPIQVNILDSNNIIYYYTVEDYKTISNYLYYFNNVIPSTLTTIIYLFDNKIDVPNSYIPLVDPSNKVSSYFKQTSTQTIFDNPNLYSTFQLNNSITFIQQNTWYIQNFTTTELIISFNSPFDFVLNTTIKYHYKVNDIMLETSQIIKILDTIYITLTEIFTDLTLNLVQYYVETDFNVLFNLSQPNYNVINYNERLGEKFINKITNIETNNEYLYYFNFVIKYTTNTIIYLYDKNVDNIYNTYEPQVDPENKESIYLNYTTDTTRFTTSILYTDQELSSHILFVQKNSWTITKYTATDTSITFDVPSDFVLNTSSKYYYKINDIIVNKKFFIFSNGNIIIQLDNSFTDTSLVFKQYYIETNNGALVIPILNISVKITYEIPYQYTSMDNVYIIPYTFTRNEYDELLYIINTGISTVLFGFQGKYNDSNNKITLYCNGFVYNGKIFDEYDDNNIYYVISLSEQININNTYTYSFNSFNDSIIYPIQNIQFYQNSLQYGQFFKQDSQNNIYLFMDNSIHNYLQTISDLISNPSKFYLVSYDQYILVNLYDPNKFIQNSQMSRTTQSTITYNTTTETPIFNDYSKLFSSYGLYFNDQLAEEINEDIININKYLYCTENDRRQIENMTKIRFNGTSWELYIPLIFWFCGKPGLSIPLVAMPHTDMILKYKLNDIKKVLSNDLSGSYSLSTIPEVKITLVTEFVLLDMIERSLFGTYSHEYIINRYKIYPNLFINSETQYAHISFTGLVKDIFLISKPLNSNLTYYTQEIPKYDYKYGRYITALEYYNIFIINNVYTSQDQIKYATDIEIIKNNMIELNIYNITGIGDRIKLLLDVFNPSYLNYFMYYEDMYLSKLSAEQQIDILIIYLKFQYSNQVYINEISPLQSLSIRANGTELFAARDYMYYNHAIPYTKFKNSLPTGYYTYSFSLSPLDDQPSGHLNFTYFDDITFLINSNIGVNSKPYLLETIVKEYNVLRIMSGIGSLAWIH
jgi:hypothetical protein